MNVSRSAFRPGRVVWMLAVLVFGVGLGRVVATVDRPDADLPLETVTLDLTRHRTTIVDGIPGARGNLGVSCPTGTVVGGGFSHVSPNLRVIESRPHGIDTWRVSWQQTSTDDSALYAYAICLITHGSL
ncbi:MAG: hypothetical protein R6W93_08770 [Candidatus Limnocylindrales bacterium]|jgi:hypothetical protein